MKRSARDEMDGWAKALSLPSLDQWIRPRQMMQLPQSKCHMRMPPNHWNKRSQGKQTMMCAPPHFSYGMHKKRFDWPEATNWIDFLYWRLLFFVTSCCQSS
ncbi:hypothetical protein C2845_PM11G27080 [Panicum miliaceum]|uniref:Uncharacterized protein n=1 Tax=Panicum miliaceum TaxID=4540 RepID=A0A3L6RVI3_PANMI|nr:hypothetical protein C2845_PM11G27080 [Panicum miliaceum]